VYLSIKLLNQYNRI